MKYLIISNDDKLTKQFVNSLEKYNIKTLCCENKEDNAQTFAFDNLMQYDAIVADVSDVKTIVEALPLESIQIVTITRAGSKYGPNPFKTAMENGDIKMPISVNCMLSHDYDRNENGSTTDVFAEYLNQFKSEHNSLNIMVRHAVKDDFIEKGEYEGTVQITNDETHEISSVSSDVFTDIVMGDLEVYRQVVSAYLMNHPVTT